jgi:hypothetical protein
MAAFVKAARWWATHCGEVACRLIFGNQSVQSGKDLRRWRSITPAFGLRIAERKCTFERQSSATLNRSINFADP